MTYKNIVLITYGAFCVLVLLLPKRSLTMGINPMAIQIRSAPMSGQNMAVHGPPHRPSKFESVDELNAYLVKLAQYYKMMGRPRFGKRSSVDDEWDSYKLSNQRRSMSSPLYSSTRLRDLLKRSGENMENEDFLYK